MPCGRTLGHRLTGRNSKTLAACQEKADNLKENDEVLISAAKSTIDHGILCMVLGADAAATCSIRRMNRGMPVCFGRGAVPALSPRADRRAADGLCTGMNGNKVSEWMQSKRPIYIRTASLTEKQ